MKSFSNLKETVIRSFKLTQHDATLGDINDTGAPSLLWSEMLNFIYSGKAPLANKLLEETWPAQNGFKQKFIKEFWDQLAQSPYFHNLHLQD